VEPPGGCFIPGFGVFNHETWEENVVMEIILGIIVLILDIWALVSVLGSGASTGSKVLWILLILILPVIGFIIWFFAGPRSRAARA
jgi:hypothetical protein